VLLGRLTLSHLASQQEVGDFAEGVRDQALLISQSSSQVDDAVSTTLALI
jgi:hypothetical protein